VDEGLVWVMVQVAAMMAEKDEGLVWVMVQVAAMMAEKGEANAGWLRGFALQMAEAIGKPAWEQLNQSVVQLYHECQYSQATTLAEEALTLARQIWGEEHPNVATSLNNLAYLYESQGRYAEAQPLLEQALEMRKRLFVGDHPNVASSLNNLAYLYNSQGRYAEAQPLLEQALEMRKRLFVGDHPNVAISLNNLAALYESQGRYAEAQPLYQQAFEMTKRLFAGDHPNVASSLNNLAYLYKSQGRYAEALPLFEQALEMTKRLFVGDHPYVASSLNNLAYLYNSQGRYAEAQPLLEQALEMRKRLFVGDHPDVATSLNNLAYLYQSQGRYAEAQPLLEQALEMRKRLFVGDHPDVASSLNNLAALYKSQGGYAEALPLYEQALEMTKGLFVGDHPNVAKMLNNLAVLLAATHRYSEALERMKEAAAMENRLISQAFAASSERDRLTYLQLFRTTFEGVLSLVSHHLHDSPQAKQAALDLVLQRKALTAAALAALNQAIYSGRYPHLTEELKKLRELSDQIIHFTFTQPQPDRIPQLQAEHNKLQQQLASQVPEIQLQEQPIDCRTVALELPTGSTLIEFVCFDVFDFHATSKKSQWQPPRYLAFILPAGQPDKVQMIDLGEAEPIDQLIQGFRHYASDGYLAVHSLDMGGDDDEPEDLRQPPAEVIELCEAIVEPLCPYLQKHQHLFIAPDGNLNLLPFQILPIDETGEQLLMDEYRISYLSVGRDILRSQVQVERSASQSLVIADPDFNLEDLTPPCPPSPEGRGEEESYSPLLASYSPLLAAGALVRKGQGERSTAELLETLTSSTFERTKGTRLLGESVAKLLGVSPYLDKEALASRLTGCQSPEILLIATHGLFSREVQLQDYWNLILALLTCPDGQEAELLQKNRNLLDKTLLEVMEKVAAILAEDGKQNAADWLRNCAAQLAAIIDQSTQQTPIQNPIAPNSPYQGNPPNLPYQGGNSKIPLPDDPMLRSALAFAGANAWLQGKTLPNEAGKGLVFAQDVAALDLWATELAVLSACNTAMGDIKIGEGVFGLRRAFAVAGAKTLVMSLWSVPDRATALLMERFFTNLHQGLGRADALQDAQNYIRTITVKDLQQSSLGLAVLEELEKLLPQDYQFCQDNRPLEHPYFWGAWVCQGDTTAMVQL
jgi:tetratricopeptide (TPR) repeat protein